MIKVESSPPVFTAPWWLRNGHLQTLWSRKLSKEVTYEREIAKTLDGDQIAFDYLLIGGSAPVLCLFHGLEGCSQSHTIRQLASWFHSHNWSIFVPHFRSCGIMNKLPRSYHAGDFEDADWMLRYVAAAAPQARAVYAVGISFGGNVLAKWLGKQPHQNIVRAAATICSPFNLADTSNQLEKRFNKWLYGNYFLKKVKSKMKVKVKHYPFLLDRRALDHVRTLREFDEIYTAPVHGFASAEDYYRKASALPEIENVATPLLCIFADNDPLINMPPPPANPRVLFESVQGAGHAGFVTAPWPGSVEWLAMRLENFFSTQS